MKKWRTGGSINNSESGNAQGTTNTVTSTDFSYSNVTYLGGMPLKV